MYEISPKFTITRRITAEIPQVERTRGFLKTQTNAYPCSAETLFAVIFQDFSDQNGGKS